MDEAEVTKQVSPEMERTAAQRARDRAKAAMWDLDVAAYMFAVLIIIIILLYQDIRIEIVAPIAIIGLVMGWLTGRRKGEQAYRRFYADELTRLEQELKKPVKETVDEKVQKALRERRR